MPAVLRFGLCVLVAGACGSKSHTGQLPTNLEASALDPSGDYWCAIDDDQHLEFHCRIERVGGKITLAKLTGGDRLRGEIVIKGDQLEFSGERFCILEDCTMKLSGTFKPVGNGQYRGTFKDAPLFVKLAPMPAGTGGKGYGGSTYGAVDRGQPIRP
jgi:hypothetical protein